MDNQQERFELELAWLAGIIEGEGWISLILYKSQQKNKTSTIALNANIGMVNCDTKITDQVCLIFQTLNIKYRYQERAAGIGSDGILRKAKTEVSIFNRQDIKKLAPLILPYMIGDKKERLLKVLEFFEIRSKKPVSGPKSKYGKEEFILYKEMYAYKGKSRSKILNDLTLDELIKKFEDKV